MSNRTHTYFASDFHLGIDGVQSSVEREKHIISWLGQISHNAKEIYLVGDIFDYWFEYKKVVPKGYFRLFSALASLIEDGIPIHFFKGNHDLWQYEYLEKEIGVTMHHGPLETIIDNHRFFIAHGDGLGQGDLKYKILKGIMTNRLCQKMFSLIHPTIGLGLMQSFSAMSRNGHQNSNDPIETNKRCISFCESHLIEKPDTDYFVMGHWHHPLKHQLRESSYYFNLGDWVSYFSYGVWDGTTFRLEYFKN